MSLEQDVRIADRRALEKAARDGATRCEGARATLKRANTVRILLLPLLAAGASSGAAPREAPAPPGRQVIRVHYVPRDRETGRYQYVPFDVPAGTTRLEIEYRYDRAGGANVVDLGLFEPGPLDLGTRSFRGWSGGERSRIRLGPAEATPGYWPGSLPAGRWHVMLGLYKVSEAGADVEVVVETGHEPAGPTPALPPRPREPLRGGPAWFSGALHAHTVHSDGTLSAKDLARKAREEGLDFLAITDHNNTTHQLEALDALGLLAIVGEEVTTPGGHACVWGLGGWRDYVDFRVLPGDPALTTLVQSVRARGALFSVNHPVADCLDCSWTHAIPTGVVGIEISNQTHEQQRAAVAIWDGLLRQGRRTTAVGSSDWHRGPRPLGSASVRVWARELSVAAVLEAIREGRVVVMADARTPPPELRARAGRTEAAIGDTLSLRPGQAYEVEVAANAPAYEGATVELVWNGEPAGKAPLRAAQPARFERTAAEAGYLRVHVLAADGSPLAITNPIYVRLAAP